MMNPDEPESDEVPRRATDGNAAIVRPLGAVSTILLAPVFLVQGLYVRAVTPRLPEAAGPGEGSAGTGEALRLLIAGDSAAAGVGVVTQEDALTGQLVRRLAAHRRVSWKLHARIGWDSTKLIAELRTLGARPFDVALLSVGVNDVTAFTSGRLWRENLHSIIELLERRFEVRRVLLTAIPPMHLFPALPQPLRRFLGGRAIELNASMGQVAAATPSARHLTFEVTPGPDAIARDGFHPGRPTYAAWAQCAADAILNER